MKARKVKGLDPDAPLADNAERIIRVRLKELYSFTPRALDPDEVEALHDLRIAAKRLRYLLELTGFCFGAYATTAAKRFRELQDVVGEIHDCDVMRPRVLEQIELLRAADAAAVRELAGHATDLDPRFAARAPGRQAYRGLEIYAIHLSARRALLFDRFLATWKSFERRGLRARLERALAERPIEAPSEEDRSPHGLAADGRRALREAVASRALRAGETIAERAASLGEAIADRATGARPTSMNGDDQRERPQDTTH